MLTWWLSGCVHYYFRNKQFAIPYCSHIYVSGNQAIPRPPDDNVLDKPLHIPPLPPVRADNSFTGLDPETN